MDYTNLYSFLTSTGVIVPDDKSVLLGIQTKFQEIFGTDIDLSAETPVGRLIEAFAVVVKSTLGVTAQTANQFNVNEATGIYLDAIAQIYDLKRIAGTKTKITIKCTFSDNPSGTSTIPAGALVMCSSNGAIFRIDAAIPNNGEIDDDGKYYAMGTATAIKAGPIVTPIGTVDSIQTAVMGWVGVTNVAPTYTGTDIETDEAFRKRIVESRPIGVGFNSHLVSALNRLDGVYSNCVLENNTGTPIVKKDVIIPPHSIFVAVDCIETEELLQSIALEVSRAKPLGTGMVNSNVKGGTLFQRSVSYGYNNGYSQTIDFYKADKTAILVDLTYSYGSYTGDNIEGDIATVIAEYLSTIGVGGTVYGTMIANKLINSLNIGVGSVWLQKSGSKQAADAVVEMMGYEVPYSLPEHITSTEVG
jgi:uncharacterized phage protein gp47/JayE